MVVDIDIGQDYDVNLYKFTCQGCFLGQMTRRIHL